MALPNYLLSNTERALGVLDVPPSCRSRNMAAERGENWYIYFLVLCLVVLGFCAVLLAQKRCGGDRTARTWAMHYDENKASAEEIDSMRAATILRCLNGFTLVSLSLLLAPSILPHQSFSNAQLLFKLMTETGRRAYAVPISDRNV